MDSLQSWWESCFGDTRKPTSGCFWLILHPNDSINPVEWIVVGGTTSALALAKEKECGTDLPAEKEPRRCLRIVSDHTEAAKLFCEAQETARYYGDVELIRGAVAHWDEQERKPCAPEPTPLIEGYEPYALVISNHNLKDLDLRLTLALYRMANDGGLRRMLRSYFPEAAMISEDLESLYRILSIPPGAVLESSSQ